MQIPWHWWHDAVVLSQMQVVLSVLALFIGVGLGILAYRLAARQVEIAKRQTDMQEEQHAFFRDQQSKKPDLRMMVDGTDSQFSSNMGGLHQAITTIRFSVHNGGNKGAEPFYWELLIPEALSPQIRFIDDTGASHDGKISHQSETEHYRKVDGHYTHKLPAFSGTQVAKVIVSEGHHPLETFVVKWRIRGDEEMIPPQGLAFFKFKRLPDTTYAWSRWHPGQKEDEIQ